MGVDADVGVDVPLQRRSRCAEGVLITTHILCISLTLVPVSMFTGSSNPLSKALIDTFKRQDIVSLTATINSSEALVTTFLISFLVDMFGPKSFLLGIHLFQFLCAFICSFCRTATQFIVMQFFSGLTGEAVIMIQARLMHYFVPLKWQPTGFALIFACTMVGHMLASIILGPIQNLQHAYLICACFIIISIILASIYTILEIRRKQLDDLLDKYIEAVSSDETSTSPQILDLYKKDKRSDITVSSYKYNKEFLLGFVSTEAEDNPSSNIGPAAPNSFRVRKSTSRHCKDLFMSMFHALKGVNPLIWIVMVPRLLIVGGVLTFNATSVLAITSILKISNDDAVSANALSQMLSAVFLFLSGAFSGLAYLGPIFSVLLGVTLYVVTQITLYELGGLEEYQSRTSANIIMSLLGISIGLFASNISFVIVSLAGRALPATSLGLVFSLQYLVSSISISIVRCIAAVFSYRETCWVIIGLFLISLPFIVSATVCMARRRPQIHKTELKIPPVHTDTLILVSDSTSDQPAEEASQTKN